MKYTKVTSLLILFLLAVFSLLAISCSESQQFQTMRIQLSKEIPRSITPEGVDLEITKYRVSGTGPGNAQFNMTTNKTTLLLESIAIGSWNVTAEGLNQNNLALVRGSTSFNFSQNNPSVTVTLNELIGKGSININFSWDPTRITNPSLVISLRPEQGNTSPITYAPTSINKSVGQASFTLNDVSAGSYVITAMLYEGSVSIAGAVEAIRVVGNSHSSGEISFDLNEKHSNGTLSITNNAGIPVTCTISGIPSNCSAFEKVTATLTPSSTSLKDLVIDWYLDGENIGRGQTIAFEPVPGFHRLDVVASTNLLGSTGSATINFEASLLGKVGEPVLANIISGDTSLKLSGDNHIAFLPDGKVLTYSGSDATFQICSIVKNTLQPEVTYNSGNANFPTEHIREFKVFGNTVFMISNSPVSTIVLDYNRNASTLSFRNSCEGNRLYDNLEQSKATSLLGVLPPVKGSNITRTLGYFQDLNTFYALSRNLNNTELPKYVWDNRVINSWINKGDDMATLYAISPDSLFNTYWTRGKAPSLGIISNLDGSIAGMFVMRELDQYVDSLVALIPLSSSILAVFEGNNIHYYEYEDLGPRISFVNIATEVRANPTDVTASVFDENGEYFYLLNTNDQSISSFKYENKRLVHISDTMLPFKPSVAALSDDGQILIVTNKIGSETAILRVKR